jgi:hypothetical protein
MDGRFGLGLLGHYYSEGLKMEDKREVSRMLLVSNRR